jgi:hypothetical protein
VEGVETQDRMMPYPGQMIFKALGRNCSRSYVNAAGFHIVPYHLRYKAITLKKSPIYMDFLDRCMPGDIGEIATFHDHFVVDYERYLVLDAAGSEPLPEHTYSNIMNSIFLELAAKGRLNPMLICWFERRNVITEDSLLRVAGLLPDITSKRVLQIVFVEQYAKLK